MSDYHLVLLLHGLYGAPDNLWCMEEQLVAEHASSDSKLKLSVLVATSYVGQRTWDGIDVNAHRVAEEVDAEIERLTDEGHRVVAFSIAGYSLGGLIARYLVGELHSRTPSFFATYRPVSFSTIATPHIGVLRYGSRRSAWIHAVGQRLFSRSGSQMYLLDGYEESRPLLDVMADPDHVFHRALGLFSAVTIIANGCNDLTVPYATAAIMPNDPFEDHERTLLIDVDNNKVVRGWRAKDEEEELVEAIVEPSEASVGNTPLPERVRPTIPPIFFLPWKPFRYALFPFLPLLIPLVLTIAAITFTIHTYQSAQRIRQHQSTGERQPLLSAIKTALEKETTARDRTPNDIVEIEPEPDGLHGASTPPLGPARGTGLLRLTHLQKDMIRNMSKVPRLKRIIAWFPHAFNSHATIIARAAKQPRWAWQAEGKLIVRVWARIVVGALDLE